MITPHEDQELHHVGSFGECSLALVTPHGNRERATGTPL